MQNLYDDSFSVVAYGQLGQSIASDEDIETEPNKAYGSIIKLIIII